MKATLLAALLAAASLVLAPVVQAQHKAAGNPNDISNLPESGPAVAPGGRATIGPNFCNLVTNPLPGSPEELDLARPNEAQLPLPEVRPVPGPPPSPLKTGPLKSP